MFLNVGVTGHRFAGFRVKDSETPINFGVIEIQGPATGNW
jgi:hypothetical protein